MCQGFKLDRQHGDCSHELVLKVRAPWERVVSSNKWVITMVH
jgi:hypothetical protein